MTVDITVTGVVQGVGFRPFVFRAAAETGISGYVKNSGGIVRIKASGTYMQINAFTSVLQKKAPEGAVIMDIKTEPAKDENFSGFLIVQSDGEWDAEFPSFPPDISTCDMCVSEMENKSNRRYLYPYISCAVCGPRFSILDRFPYDRANTVMTDFEMCGDCKKEYSDTANRYARRHYAQTISCSRCGPQAILKMKNFELMGKGAVDEAVNMLNAGAVLGVKGIGGYQFVCTPESAYAVLKLREIKMRNRKPFAVMFPSIDRLRDFASVSPAERDLLLSPARPIVILSAGRSHFERYVSGESMYLGAFLPNTGLHKILTDSCGPLIVTSGNISDEPMSFRDEDYFRHEFNAVEGVLYNKRRILTPMDDSVTRVINNKPQMIRRARGYVPIPVITEYEAPKNVLAVGGDLKAAFAISRGHRIILSQYFGDMESYEVMTNYKEAVSRMEKLYSFTPAVIVADKHPLYNSTMYARSYAEKNGIKIVTVQHHHAHIASVMAEYSLNHCIGVAFDGTGYGTDGTVWGGEFLRCRGAKYERMSHIEPVVLAGGDSAARDAKQTAECIKIAAGIESTNETLKAAIENNIGTYISTSIGRVFDAVAALLGIKTENTYEGECAIALENAAASTKTSYDMPAMDDPKEIITEVIKAAGDRVDVREIARGFHDSLVKLIVGKCMIIRDSTAERNVALSGGVFANRLLLEKTIDALEKQGFNVYINRQVPMNDQGIALGQAYLLNL